MHILGRPEVEYKSARFLLHVSLKKTENFMYVRIQKLMPLTLVLIPYSQRLNSHCFPIIQEKWKFSFVGPALRDVNPFSGNRKSGRGPGA
jgi:hypothetical protein